MFYCHNCTFEAKSVNAARKHAREAEPVWSPARQTMLSHKLTNEKPEIVS